MIDPVVERALITGAVPTASAASRWMVCAPSYKLEMACNDGETSDAAEGGKRMHKAMERWEDDPITVIEDCKLVDNEPDLFRRGAEFRAYNLNAIFGDEPVEYIIEERHLLTVDGVTYTSGEPDLAALGTVSGTLYLEDYKGGRVKVESVVRNKQLKDLTAILLAKYTDRIKRVLWSINQPLAKLTDRWVEVDPSMFDKLITGVIGLAKAAIESDNTGHVAGVHCTYCKAKAICPVTQSIVKRLAGYKELVKQIPNDKLGELLTEGKTASKLIEVVEKEAFERAVAGNPPDGWVLQKDNRRFGVTAIDDVLGKDEKYKPILKNHIVEKEQVRKVRSIDDKDVLLADLKAAGLTEVQEKSITCKLVRID